MEKKEVLGFFNYQNNGEIYVKMGSNLRFGSEAVTYVHEVYHDRLSNFSMMGRLLNLIGIACAVATEEKQSILKKYGDVFVKHTRKVQEVYASTMTWLWLERKENEIFKAIYREIESEEYRKYRKTLARVVSNEMIPLKEKERLVDGICRYALNANLNEENFWKCFDDVDALDIYMETIVRPEERMTRAYDCIIKGNSLPQEKEIDELDFIEKLCTRQLFEDLGDLVRIAKKQIPKVDMDSNLSEKYLLSREKKIKVFDISALQVIRGERSTDTDMDAFCIFKNCKNLDDEDNYYVIRHSACDGKSIYLGQEVSLVQNIIENNEFVIIPFSEYDRYKWRPVYFETDRPIFVLLDNYDECEQWGRALLDDGEIYWGDIYSNQVNNFFTVNFFVKRGRQNVIFVFPTTKILANNLQKELGVEKYVLYSEQDEFFKIFGCFQKGVTILKVYRNLMAFLLDSAGNFTEDTALVSMSCDMVRTIADSILNLHTPDNYFEQMMYFPTKQTEANGNVWILMEFKKNGRVGNIKTETAEKIMESNEIVERTGILVFNSRRNAEAYLKQCGNLINYYPVEMDMIFWKYFKPRLRQSEYEIFLYRGMEYGDAQIIDEAGLEYMLYMK